MARNPVNAVDAVARYTSRVVRNRSAILRFGKVTVAPAGGYVTVAFGTVPIPCAYLVGAALAVNDWVCAINDGDKWIVLGKVAP
jgi:hypothetical protein